MLKFHQVQRLVEPYLSQAGCYRHLGGAHLSDPVLFPLFAALGLALAGAEWIEIDSDETWVRFRGTHLGPHFLQEGWHV